MEIEKKMNGTLEKFKEQLKASEEAREQRFIKQEDEVGELLTKINDEY